MSERGKPKLTTNTIELGIGTGKSFATATIAEHIDAIAAHTRAVDAAQLGTDHRHHQIQLALHRSALKSMLSRGVS